MTPRDTWRWLASLAVVLSCVAIAEVGLLFWALTDGLVADIGADGGPRFCRDRHGSENDADLVMPMLGVFLIPAAWRWIRRKRHVSFAELVLTPVIIVVSVGMLNMAGCGIGIAHDRFHSFPWFHVIQGGMVLYPVAMALLLFLRWPKLILP